MKERSMPSLPQHITERLKRAGAMAYTIRMGNASNHPNRPTYQWCIDEIDAATEEVKRARPDLYREGSQP